MAIPDANIQVKDKLNETSSGTSSIDEYETPPMSNKTRKNYTLAVVSNFDRRCSSDDAFKCTQFPKEIQCHERSKSLSNEVLIAHTKARMSEKFDELEQSTGLKLSTNAINDQSSPETESASTPDEFSFSSTGSAGKRRTCSVAEIKEQATIRMEIELKKTQLDLKLKDEEIVKLSRIRKEVESELEDLTVSLFEEANKMVHDANVRRAKADKGYKEAKMKIDMLQAEVSALKTLVMTSTPSRPNPHLHPQIEPPKNGIRAGEVDPLFYEEFSNWKEDPSFDKEKSSFIKRIFDEEIFPALNFKNDELTKTLLNAIEDNSIIVESVSEKGAFPKKCALLDIPRICKYRMKLENNWYNISQLARNRIIAVCDLFSYLRYIKQGLVKSGCK